MLKCESVRVKGWVMSPFFNKTRELVTSLVFGGSLIRVSPNGGGLLSYCKVDYPFGQTLISNQEDRIHSVFFSDSCLFTCYQIRKQEIIPERIVCISSSC